MNQPIHDEHPAPAHDAPADAHASCHHGSEGCRGCATGHPCAACRARLDLKKAGGDQTDGRPPDAGFTLMELLIVIGLLGALTMLVLPRLQVTKSWAADDSMAPAEMMDIRRAYAAFQADCLPTAADQTNFARSGLAILMTTNLTGASGLSFPLEFDAQRGKGWRGPYLQPEGERNVYLHEEGQPTNGSGATATIPVICDPRYGMEAVRAGEHYYRVLRRTNDLHLVYIGADGSLTNETDNAEQVLGVP